MAIVMDGTQYPTQLMDGVLFLSVLVLKKDTSLKIKPKKMLLKL
jgi:hypothetical protein